MKTVYKYPFDVDDEIVIRLPIGAEILKLDVQRGQPCLWALVAPTAETEQRNFRLAGTGHPLPDWNRTWRFIDSFQMLDGDLVYHLWETT